MINNIDSKQVYNQLTSNKNAFLIDVRTQEEFDWVGNVCDSYFCNKQILHTWKNVANPMQSSQFSNILTEIILNKSKSLCATQEQAMQHLQLYFICRSGGRSGLSVVHLTNLGWQQCFNVLNGFEGDLNDQHQRGKINGWKFNNLPWRQS
jgi:rhodanese-related sulfurtransferase